jgi:hypothetical protein
MFGAPSGALYDPADAVAGGVIEEGWLLAPLDLQPATDRPYGDAVRFFVRSSTAAGFVPTSSSAARSISATTSRRSTEASD